jgi:Ca2+/Na+ antiporter
LRLKSGNDHQKIYKPTPFLLESEKRIADIVSQTSSGFLAVKGSSLQDALEREESYAIHGISGIVPSIKKQKENFLLKKKLYSKELKNFTAQTGITPYDLPQTPSFLTPENLEGTALDKILKAGIVRTEEEVYLVSPAQEGKVFEDKNITVIKPREIIAQAFDKYCLETVKLISVSFAVLAAILFILFRKKILLYFLPTASGVVATLGAMGWMGETLNFFHALCLFVFIGLGLDYTIFHLSGSSKLLRRTVYFSFLTSLTGLGMLALTSFNVTRSMGITFAFGLFFCYFFSLRDGKNETKDDSRHWFEKKEQSAGKFRIMILWYLYSIAGKHLVKIICIPVIAFIYPFASPARKALKKFYSRLEAFEKEKEDCCPDKFSIGELFILAIATSIDALAVGITFALIAPVTGISVAVILIGVITFALSFVGVVIGNKFGAKYKKRAELAGGIILCLMGLKILLEHLEIINF